MPTKMKERTVIDLDIDNAMLSRSLYDGLSFDEHRDCADVISAAYDTWHKFRLSNGATFCNSYRVRVIASGDSIEVRLDGLDEE